MMIKKIYKYEKDSISLYQSRRESNTFDITNDITSMECGKSYYFWLVSKQHLTTYHL